MKSINKMHFHLFIQMLRINFKKEKKLKKNGIIFMFIRSSLILQNKIPVGYYCKTK